MKMRGAFFTFEGPEGAGKTTVIAALADRMRAHGHGVCVTRQPGAAAGGAIREILLHGDDLEPLAEVFLFLADRVQHVATVVRPALQRGEIVLCDRYADSTVVYQGHARGLDIDRLRDWNAVATGGLAPDLTLLLDLPPEVGLARATKGDRLDKESLEFHRRVRLGFLSEAEREPARWRVIDATQPLEQVIAMCLDLCLEAP